MSRTVPKQKPGRSEQVVCTPPEFLNAVCRRLCIDWFIWDLAASTDNTIVEPNANGWRHYDEADDALVQTWPKGGWCWLNPPFGDIEPWVRKASIEAANGASTVVLVPASVGSNWWRHYVEPFSYVSYLNGRLTFVGHKTCYPKDLALLLYTPWGFSGHETWRWKANL